MLSTIHQFPKAFFCPSLKPRHTLWSCSGEKISAQKGKTWIQLNQFPPTIPEVFPVKDTVHLVGLHPCILYMKPCQVSHKACFYANLLPFLWSRKKNDWRNVNKAWRTYRIPDQHMYCGTSTRTRGRQRGREIIWRDNGQNLSNFDQRCEHK